MEHPVRKQLREDLRLAGMAETSQASYLEAVDLFFKRTWLDPENVTQEDFADYLKTLQDNAAAQGTFKIARFAIACYDLLMRVSAEAVMTLCQDKKHLGATPALLAVLHTWTGRMDYHPHVHMLVSAGGVSDDGTLWLDSKPGFLIPVKALSRMLRNRMAEGLKKTRPDLFAKLKKSLWKKEWVANILPWGAGERGVLDYLARYVFRIAITNSHRQNAETNSQGSRGAPEKFQKSCRSPFCHRRRQGMEPNRTFARGSKGVGRGRARKEKNP